MTTRVAATLDLDDPDAVQQRKRELAAATFSWEGVELAYHVDGGNKPFDNERAVELAIARHVLTSGPQLSEVLEVGNVLGHYFQTSHAVVDKFEHHPKVTWNADVRDFTPPFAPQLIISVSTLEHVGHVERPRDPAGFADAVGALVGWLRPGGELLITVPLGYNPAVLELLERPDQPFDDVTVMRRTSAENRWAQTTLAEARDLRYGDPYPCANAIVVARARKPVGVRHGAGVGSTYDAESRGDGTSTDLRRLYDGRYYRRMAGGSVHARGGQLKELTNIWHAASLVLAPRIARAVDIGAGRGDLARHLLAEGTRVTLLDYSESAIQIAREHVGSSELATFVVGDATRLLEHVEPGSQDAVYLTDVVEHVSTPELRLVFDQVREVLTADGTLVVHTPEKYSGSVLTTSAVQGVHINLFQIDTLAQLLDETFAFVDTFTWNGVERFAARGRSIELFAVARQHPFEIDFHPAREVDRTTVVELEAGPGDGWHARTLATDPRLPARFALRFDLETLRSATDGTFQVLLLREDEPIAWSGSPLARLRESPADIFITSECLNRLVPDAPMESVTRIVARVSSSCGVAALRLSDVRVLRT